MTEPKRVPVTMGGYQVGWAIPDGDEISIEITDEGTYKKITKGMLEGLSIYGDNANSGPDQEPG